MDTKIELLKCHVTKGEKVYTNLYLQINGGNPIAITLAGKEWNKKIFGLLCANAREVVISRNVNVQEVAK